MALTAAACKQAADVDGEQTGELSAQQNVVIVEQIGQLVAKQQFAGGQLVELIGGWAVGQLAPWAALVIEHGQVVLVVISVQEMNVEVVTAAELKAGGGTVVEDSVTAVDISNGAEFVLVSAVAEVVLLASDISENLLAKYFGTKPVLLNYSMCFGISLT